MSISKYDVNYIVAVSLVRHGIPIEERVDILNRNMHPGSEFTAFTQEVISLIWTYACSEHRRWVEFVNDWCNWGPEDQRIESGIQNLKDGCLKKGFFFAERVTYDTLMDAFLSMVDPSQFPSDFVRFRVDYRDIVPPARRRIGGAHHLTIEDAGHLAIEDVPPAGPVGETGPHHLSSRNPSFKIRLATMTIRARPPGSRDRAIRIVLTTLTIKMKLATVSEPYSDGSTDQWVKTGLKGLTITVVPARAAQTRPAAERCQKLLRILRDPNILRLVQAFRALQSQRAQQAQQANQACQARQAPEQQPSVNEEAVIAAEPAKEAESRALPTRDRTTRDTNNPNGSPIILEQRAPAARATEAELRASGTRV